MDMSWNLTDFCHQSYFDEIIILKNLCDGSSVGHVLTQSCMFTDCMKKTILLHDWAFSTDDLMHFY